MNKNEYDPEICNFKNENKKCPCCGIRAASENALHNCRANPIFKDLQSHLEPMSVSIENNDDPGCTPCDKIKKLKERLAKRKAEIENAKNAKDGLN